MVHHTARQDLQRMVPLLLSMGVIFYFSHQPGDTLKLPNIAGLDKIAHALEYGVLAATALYAAWPLVGTFSLGWLGTGVIVFCFVHAMADEFHQSFIPGRTASGWDVLADVVGALVMAAVWVRKALKSSASGAQKKQTFF